MDLREITPFITIFGPLAIIGMLLDFAVRDEHKAHLWEVLVRTAQLANRPVSFAFYGLVTCASIGLTVMILSISGLLEVRTGGSIFLAVKSSGPLLLAVVLKVLVLDYLLALKTYWFIRGLAKPRAKSLPKPLEGTNVGLLILCDLLLTGLITGACLNWGELFQATNLPSDLSKVPSAAKPAIEFFDTLNFLVKDSIQKSFYALNGSLLMYGAWLTARIADGMDRWLNLTAIKGALFKILAGAITLIGIVLLVARQLS